jgi:hypothetical protein
MSLSSRVLRSGAIVAVLAVAPVLSACTGFTPVYGDNGLGNQRVEVAYGQPHTRLEQIVYQDLALKLGKSTATSGVPRVNVGVTAVLPVTDTTTATTTVAASQVTVTAIVTVIGADGAPLFQGSRSVVEDFVKGGQAFSNQQAAKDAAERGARELSETIRLQVIAALLKK